MLSIELDGSGVELDLREWVNSGLMAFFFFVVGLEARREFDLGDLRERSRVTVPVAAALGGMAIAIAVYLAFNAGSDSAGGWGVAMSTDTALALGLLALAGRRFPDRLRAFLVTVVVVDDLIALVVIATVYSEDLSISAFAMAIYFFGLMLVLRQIGVRVGLVYFVLGAATWVALLKAGVDPIVVGLLMGLLTYATPPERSQLERATERFREFREQPTPHLARSAGVDLRRAVSPNERLQALYHPWTSYVVVPVFALANAGIAVNGDLLSRAYGSPITLGILVGYLAGKPVGIVGGSWVVSRLSRGRLRPPVGWAAVAGAGASAGAGFTVALLIAAHAFDGAELQEAKIGILSAVAAASLATFLVVIVTRLLPRRMRLRALISGQDPLVDLDLPVDPARDHIRGPVEAHITVVEYGDFECPYCGQAEPVMRELLQDFGDVRYVWRHLPLNDVHPNTQLAAEAAEAAAEQGAFWEMHDLLLANQDKLSEEDLMGYADGLGLDLDRFAEVLGERTGAAHVAEDVDSADMSGVTGTPTFFINGRRHFGAYDIDTLSAAVRAARARAMATSGQPSVRR
jgi:Na+/H+ antiporter NhaA